MKLTHYCVVDYENFMKVQHILFFLIVVKNEGQLLRHNIIKYGICDAIYYISCYVSLHYVKI